MAWIRKRKRKDGGTTYYVTWREPGATKESTLTIRDDLAEAQRNVRILEANGDSYEAAQRAVANANIGGPTVKEYMQYHVDMLTKAGPYQIQRYKRAINNHFSSTLGNLPLKAVQQRDVIQWIRYMQNKEHQGQPLKAKTTTIMVRMIFAVMILADDIRYIRHNQCAVIDLPKDAESEAFMRFMNVQESNALVMDQPPRFPKVMAMLRATGARYSEVTA